MYCPGPRVVVSDDNNGDDGDDDDGDDKEEEEEEEEDIGVFAVSLPAMQSSHRAVSTNPCVEVKFARDIKCSTDDWHRAITFFAMPSFARDENGVANAGSVMSSRPSRCT